MEDPTVIMAVSHFCCSPPTRSSETRHCDLSRPAPFLSLRVVSALFLSVCSLFSSSNFAGLVRCITLHCSLV